MSATVKQILGMQGAQIVVDGERPALDFYETPEVATRRLLENVVLRDVIWEPACGGGAIAKVLEKDGHTVLASDMDHHGYGSGGIDFFNLEQTSAIALKAGECDVVTNPPYNIAAPFARRALEIVKPWRGKVAFLLRLNFMCGATRYDLFAEGPLSQVLVFEGRLPRMHRAGYTGQRASSMMDFAWFVWDWRHEGAPTVKFVPAKRTPMRLRRLAGKVEIT